MNTEKVLEILRAIGNFTEDEVKKYSSLVEINMHPFAENEYDEIADCTQNFKHFFRVHN